jgi:hypothetical protein
LAAEDGQVSVLEVFWKIHPHSPAYELKVFFYPE